MAQPTIPPNIVLASNGKYYRPSDGNGRAYTFDGNNLIHFSVACDGGNWNNDVIGDGVYYVQT